MARAPATYATSEALMRTYLEQVTGRGRLDLIEGMAHPDMVDEANLAFGSRPGVAGLRAHVKGFRRNIHDLELTVQRIAGGRDSVIGWWSFRGRMVGPWLNRKPTHAPCSATVVSCFDLRDGKIARYRLYMLAELGAETVVLDTSAPRPAPRLVGATAAKL